MKHRVIGIVNSAPTKNSRVVCILVNLKIVNLEMEVGIKR